MNELTTERRRRTLVFCTAFVGPGLAHSDTWDMRYRRWFDAIRASKLEFDQILIVDDGSQTLPDWPDIVVSHDTDPSVADTPAVLFHFSHSLGRRGVTDFPGWVRSFFFAARYAEASGFERVIHIESDAFLISARIQEYCNKVDNGWIALWCPRYSRPESGIQVIAGDSLQTYFDIARCNIDDFSKLVIEKSLPFTVVEHRFRGDRYGEFRDHIPHDADWSMQTSPPPGTAPGAFYWWLPFISDSAPTSSVRVSEMYSKDIGENLTHDGVYYLSFMKMLDQALCPESYFEIGTNEGYSLRAMSCDAVCVDPNFILDTNVIGSRKRSFLFQSTSDAFFAENNLLNYFPAGCDIAFLDGLHHFEALLRDFINAEKFCHPRSIILLHDCLPFNERMAERDRRIDTSEDPGTQDFWTGDVWKILPVLYKFRPDLRIFYLDCGPTGLIACVNLDPDSNILKDAYDQILEEFAELDLVSFGFKKLWKLFPTLSTNMLAANSQDMKMFFDLSRERPAQ